MAFWAPRAAGSVEEGAHVTSPSDRGKPWPEPCSALGSPPQGAGPADGDSPSRWGVGYSTCRAWGASRRGGQGNGRLAGTCSLPVAGHRDKDTGPEPAQGHRDRTTHCSCLWQQPAWETGDC